MKQFLIALLLIVASPAVANPFANDIREMKIGCMDFDAFEDFAKNKLMMIGSSERAGDPKYHFALFYDFKEKALLSTYGNLREVCLIAMGYDATFNPDALTALYNQMKRTVKKR